ncbi:unnamed protein product [Paramecium pentaurelia]|uniref:Transmembrane protein n=1 Tax=Paramecium pentaurelia TaxID=43138 RepID=A0A8S1S0Y6_9CILI|nr:unnamed protein product [Paramecium pentaurelia]
MNDQLLTMTSQEFQQIYQEVEFKLEKLHNKNNVIQQNLDVDIIKRELYQMIKQEIDQLQYFIEEIKDQMRQLENNINNIDSKNKIKRLKDNYLKETQRTKAITRILNNKSSFQSEKQYDGVSILSQSDTGGQPDSVPSNSSQFEYQQQNIQQTDSFQQQDKQQNGITIQNEDSPSNSMIQENQIQNNSQKGLQINNEHQIQGEGEGEVQEEINNQVYFIVLVIVIIIAVLIIWLLYDEDIL